jgi:undecaprenyl-diphosphatase
VVWHLPFEPVIKSVETPISFHEVSLHGVTCKKQSDHRDNAGGGHHARSEWLILVGGFVVALCALLLFVWLAEEMGEGDTLRFDSVVRADIHAHASARLTSIMKLVTLLGSGPAIIALTMVTLVLCYRLGQLHYAKLLAAALGGGLALELSLKLAFHRPRPVPFFDIVPPTSYSFPSGHALESLCFFSALAIIVSDEATVRNATTAWIGAILLTLLIGFSRVYLGVHYPSDVVAGYAVGIVWMITVYLVHKVHRDNIRQEQTTYP